MARKNSPDYYRRTVLPTLSQALAHPVRSAMWTPEHRREASWKEDPSRAVTDIRQFGTNSSDPMSSTTNSL